MLGHGSSVLYYPAQVDIETICSVEGRAWHFIYTISACISPLTEHTSLPNTPYLRELREELPRVGRCEWRLGPGVRLRRVVVTIMNNPCQRVS
jgi:hypothetical protein